MKKKTQTVKVKQPTRKKAEAISPKKDERTLWIAVYFILGGTFIITSIYLIKRYLESNWIIPSNGPIPQSFISMFFSISFQLIFGIALLAITFRMIKTDTTGYNYWKDFYKSIAIKIVKILFPNRS